MQFDLNSLLDLKMMLDYIHMNQIEECGNFTRNERSYVSAGFPTSQALKSLTCPDLDKIYHFDTVRAIRIDTLEEPSE